MARNKLFKGLLSIEVVIMAFYLYFLVKLGGQGNIFLEDLPSWINLFGKIYFGILIILCLFIFFAKDFKIIKKHKLIFGLICAGAGLSIYSFIMGGFILPILNLFLSFIALAGILLSFIIVKKNEKK